MQFTEVSAEVLVTTEPITYVTREDICILKAKAAVNPRKRIRLCAHMNLGDTVHEMLIVHARTSFNQPHKHPNKSESFHIIEGELDIVIFDDEGQILETITLGEYSANAKFYWRLSESNYHMVIPRSDVVVFHETTSGPFNRATSFVPAPWSPGDQDSTGQEEFMARLEEQLQLIEKSNETERK